VTITASATTSTLAGFMEGRRWIGHAAAAEKFDGPVPRQAALDLLSYPLAEGSVKVEVPIITPDGVETLVIDDPKKKAIVRTDTGRVFNYTSLGYQIHQPDEWLLKNMELITDGGLDIGTVAVTKGGALAMLQAELPEARIATAPGAEPVKHRPHFIAATSMDSSIATTYGAGTKVLACENQLGVSAFMRGGLMDVFVKIRHSANSLDRVYEIRQRLGLVVEEIGDAFDLEFRTLVGQHVSDARFLEIVKEFTGEDNAKEGRSKTIATNKGDTLRRLWKNDDRVAPWKNSMYGVLAAFNTASHHERAFGADEEKRLERNTVRTIEGKWDEFDTNILRLAGARLATV
jgi:phage/plasmid-like protein (TIGR03299 family)